MSSKDSGEFRPDASTAACPSEGPIFENGRCTATQALERLIADIAPTNIPVLVVGESGTGKDVVAFRIHRLSGHRDEPFVKVPCATLNADFFNGSLEITGEDGKTHVGPVGTVFLDEPSQLDLACQPKLLHGLFDDDGLRKRGWLGARVISSTTRNLEEEIRSGRFREELYYRINGVCLRLPPLRERPEDIPALVDFFLGKYAGLFGRPKPSISSRALTVLVKHSWPGNIRELENTVKKILVVDNEDLALADLGSTTFASQPRVEVAGNISLKQAARAASLRAERDLILEALARTHWNRKRAAKELQISYKALLYKLKQIGLDDSASS